MMKTSLLTELLDLIAPRRCAICGCRLPATEPLLCQTCRNELPVTPFPTHATDNALARLFWGQFPVERASAWFFFRSHSDPSRMVYDLKYHGEAIQGELMGEELARLHQPYSFFDGIDALVPVPLTRSRERNRGYNQSQMLARGISRVTGLPIFNKVLERRQFHKSQTHENAWERRVNVAEAFSLRDALKIRHKHLLLVDDVVTTGATIIACGKQLAQAEGVRISVIAVGYAKE